MTKIADDELLDDELDDDGEDKLLSVELDELLLDDTDELLDPGSSKGASVTNTIKRSSVDPPVNVVATLPTPVDTLAILIPGKPLFIDVATSSTKVCPVVDDHPVGVVSALCDSTHIIAIASADMVLVTDAVTAS